MYGIKLDDKRNPVLVELSTVPVKDKAQADISLGEAFAKLEEIYQQVPKSDCNRCGSCCDGTKTGDPRAYSVEYLYILRYLNSPSNKELKKKIYGAAYMAKALMEKKREERLSSDKDYGHFVAFCPAVDPASKLCSMYEHRPLICRLYGLRLWHKDKSKEWIRQTGKDGCDQVKIDDADQTEYWSRGKGSLLFKKLSIISRYHYLDEAEETLFNVGTLNTWFSLKVNERE